MYIGSFCSCSFRIVGSLDYSPCFSVIAMLQHNFEGFQLHLRLYYFMNCSYSNTILIYQRTQASSQFHWLVDSQFLHNYHLYTQLLSCHVVYTNR